MCFKISFRKLTKYIYPLIEKTNAFSIILVMKRFFLILIAFCLGFSACFGENAGMRDYDGIQLATGTFIPVISTQEISTQYCDVGYQVKFISTNDLYLYNTDVIPSQSEFFGYIEKLNEPIVGTNASMVIKITKLRFTDGFEIPIRGYIYTANGNLIGGELTEPASFDKKMVHRQWFHPYMIYIPGPTRRMGTPTVVTSGADLMIILTAPAFITHTVTN